MSSRRRPRRPRAPRLALVALMLFVSGGSALVFQVAWMRELRLVFGATTAAVAAVLAIFMAGLGVRQRGARAAGRSGGQSAADVRRARDGGGAVGGGEPVLGGAGGDVLFPLGRAGIARAARARRSCGCCWPWR